MKLPIFFLAGLVIPLFCIVGCSNGAAKPVAQTKPHIEAGATSPDERLDEARLADATKGLSFDGGLVQVVAPSPANPQQGETLRVQAEANMTEHNTWFVAAGMFRDAILADSGNAKSYEGLARALLIEGKTDLAEPSLATALSLSPKFSQARYELGMVHQMDSDYSGAVTQWKILTRTDPGYKDVYARMAIASYYAQDFASSWKYLAAADRLHQSVPPQFRPLLKEASPQP